nr:MAG TPA: hypothetical protein [Caudoviricetes sp.]
MIFLSFHFFRIHTYTALLFCKDTILINRTPAFCFQKCFYEDFYLRTN